MSRLLISLLFNRVDYIIGWRGSIDGLLKIFPSFAKKVFYTGNPIRLPKNGILAPTIKRQAGILCMVGRLELSKGILRTLYSLLLVESGDSPRMIVVGDGSAKLQFLQLVSDLGLSHRVWLLGSVPEPTDYMRLSSVLSVLSQTEGFCNVVVESLAVGTPVVTLNNGSVAKSLIKDISHGAVLDRCDVLEVARLIEFYCDLNEAFNPIPEVMRFESDEWTKRLLEFLEQKNRRV